MRLADDMLPRDWELVPLALFLLVGPLVLLSALLTRPRDPASRLLRRRAEDQDARRRVSGKKAKYRTSDEPQALSYRTGAALGALLVRIRRSVIEHLAPGTPGEPKALDTQAGREPSPVDEEDRLSDCAACGAWNTPGSEYCGECGVALEDAEV